jgi:hypothetical protein
MQKFKTLYTNGSSITQGWPLNQKDYRDYYKENFGWEWDVKEPDSEVESKISINWPNRLANILDTELIDDSRGGGSSIRAMRMAMEWAENNLDKVKNTLFVIETTAGYRDEVWMNKLNRYFNLTVTNCTNPEDITDNPDDRKLIKDELESYFKNMVDIEHHSKKEAEHFVKFYSFMKTIGAEFFIVNQAIRHHTRHHYKNFFIKHNVDDRIIKFEDNDCISAWYINTRKTALRDELKNYTDDLHPSYTAHIEIANKIYKYIKEFYGKI